MTNVFVSYSRSDRERIEPLIGFIDSVVGEVWWDDRLVAGERFTEEVERRLDEADFVVVVWTSASVHSQWVLDEAAVGRDAGKLLPVCLDGQMPPLGFRHMHATDFSKWDGTPADKCARALREALTRKPGEPRHVSPRAPPAPPRSRRRIAAYVAASIVAIAAGIAVVRFVPWESTEGSRVSSLEERRVSLAVLPFKPLTLDDRNESLELGMTETLIAGLNAGGLSVSPLSSVRKYAGIEQDGLAAGRALEVQSVLEGHIQRAGNQLRVSARLLNVSDGRQLWAQTYNEPFTDIFTVQDAIAEKVRAELTAELAGEASPALSHYTGDAEAYQLYANGRYHMLRLAIPEALAQFKQAVERDPEFALAYAGIADAHTTLGVFGVVPPHDTFPQALEAVQTALKLAPELGEAYSALGHIKMQYEHDWSGAERAYHRSIELNPNDAVAHKNLGLFLALSGRFDDGIAHLRQAQALEPSRPAFGALIGMILNYQRRYDEAIAQLRSTLAMDPGLPITNIYLAAAYLRRGEYDKAMEHLDRAQALAPGSAAYRGQILALSGRRPEAVRELERLIALSKQRYVPAYDIATIYAALGETDRTFEWLERAFEERSQLIGWLPWDAVFDGTRADPRYAPLVRRLPASTHSRG